MRDPDAVFEEVMKYAEIKLGKRELESSEDLREYLLESDDLGNLSHIKKGRWAPIQFIMDSNAAKNFLSIPKAIKKELSRSQRARRVDEAITAKDTRPITKKTVEQWRKNPGRFDLRGIDTKTHELIRRETQKKILAKRRAGFQVLHRGREPVILEASGRFRSVINGRFVSGRR